MLVRIRDAEACEPLQNHHWDSVWINHEDVAGAYADWILAGPEDPAEQRGGLRSRMQLHTSVTLCLFTDRRLPEGMRPPGDQKDPRGWWGNSIRLEGEPAAELGSLLWTLERGTISNDTARIAKDFCEDALQVLLDQGAVGRFEIETAADIRRGFLSIKVHAFDNAGQPLTSMLYDVVWRQLRTPARMNYTR